MKSWRLSHGVWAEQNTLPFPIRDSAGLTLARKRAHRSELMRIKHMAERYVEPSKDLAKTYWMFYLPDFTRVFRDWYLWYIAEMLHTYDLDASASAAWDGKFFTLRYEGARPITRVSEWITNQQHDKLDALYASVDQAERVANESLRACTRGRLTQRKLRDCVVAVTAYATFGLNNVFPEELFEKTFPTIPPPSLFTTNISAWGLLWKSALESLEHHYVHKTSFESTVRAFASHHARLRWGDIESRGSDIAFSTRILQSASVTYPSRFHILRDQILEEGRNRITRYSLLHEKKDHLHNRKLSRERRDLLSVYIKFGAYAQRYNEVRRITFTQCLALMRTYAEQNGIDWKTAPLTRIIGPLAETPRR